MRNFNTIGRRPRHLADDTETVTTELVRIAGEFHDCVAVELLDLSRQGARVRADAEIELNETLTFSLQASQPALDLRVTAVVRWRKQEADGRWSYGCEFKEELPLETLGELFLCGVLSVRPPASSGPT